MNRVSPRIHMTLWYVAIVSVVAVIFAGFIYQVTIANIMRHSMVLQSRMRASFNRPHLPKELLERIAEDQDEVEHLLLLRLTLITGAIIAAAAVASYHLAGKSLKPLEEAITLQKQFVTDTSHELKTPIAALRTHLEVALKEKKISQKEYKVALTEALATVIDMQEMVHKMLQSSQLSEHVFTKRQVSVNTILKKVIARIQKTYYSKEITYDIDVAPVELLIDPRHLEQLLTIVIENAAKYCRQNGRVLISLIQQKKSIQLKITDDGDGIAKKDLKYVFNRFYRADASRARNKKHGQGLGLSIAKNLLKVYGGEITIDSREGSGTEVSITFPT